MEYKVQVIGPEGQLVHEVTVEIDIAASDPEAGEAAILQAASDSASSARNCLECGQQIQVRADGRFVTHAYPGVPVECQGSEEAAYGHA